MLAAGPAVELVLPDLAPAQLVRHGPLVPHVLVKIRRRLVLPLCLQREKSNQFVFGMAKGRDGWEWAQRGRGTSFWGGSRLPSEQGMLRERQRAFPESQAEAGCREGFSPPIPGMLSWDEGHAGKRELSW